MIQAIKDFKPGQFLILPGSKTVYQVLSVKVQTLGCGVDVQLKNMTTERASQISLLDGNQPFEQVTK